jgi:uncharacterized delta-60 repeat protein
VGWVSQVAVASDGALFAWVGRGQDSYVWALDYSLQRIRPDGQLDAAFVPAAEAMEGLGSQSQPQWIAHRDGVLLVQNTARDVVAGRPRMKRLNSTGTVDTSFLGLDRRLGFVETADGLPIVVHMGGLRILHVKPDGSSIIAMGEPDPVVPGGRYTWTLGLAHADGTLAAEWPATRTAGGFAWMGFDEVDDGSGGTAFVDTYEPSAEDLPFSDAALMGDGSIVVGGSFTAVGSQEAAGLVRIKADGTPDPTFGTVGKGTSRSGPCGSPTGVDRVRVDDLGGIWIAGNFEAINGTPRSGLARLRADGTVDPGFVTDLVRVDGLARGADIALAADGSVWVTGSFVRPGELWPSALNHLLVRVPPVPPTLAVLVVGADCELRLAGPAGGTWVLQWSDDLTHWTDLREFPTFSGDASATDPILAGRAFRFYRAISR